MFNSKVVALGLARLNIVSQKLPTKKNFNVETVKGLEIGSL